MNAKTRIHVFTAAAALCILVLAGPAEAYQQAPNTVSVGLQSGAGGLSGSGTYLGGANAIDYSDFGLGLAPIAIRLRYSLDPTHALGISLEDLRFGRKSGLGPPVARQYQSVNFLVDYYLYFNRRKKVCPYVVLGPGFHRDAFRFSKSDIVIPPEGFLANLGTGVEYFVSRAFAFDGSVRGYYLAGGGGRSTAAEVMIGIHVYTGQGRR